jgi:hypothetical protein
MSQTHSGNVQPSIDNEEHDHLPGGVAVKKVGSYVWNGTSWERFTGTNTEKPACTYTWDGEYLSQKVAVYADRTETTDYTWTDGKLTNKETTIT